jgi:putative phage-type endonuclease
MLSEQRKGRITGSQAGAILGLNPWKSEKQVMDDMLGITKRGPDTAPLIYGKFNEEHAKFYFEIENNLVVEPCGFYIHPEHDWLGATPDGLVGDCALIEIKCPYGLRDKENPIFKTVDDLPHYFAQMQIEMDCAKRDKCYFYQWSIYGSRLDIINKDQSWLDENIPKLKDFYDDFKRLSEASVQ